VALLRKIKRILSEEFPPPAKVSLEDHDGVIGSILSERFQQMDALDRQNLIGEILAAHLDQKELRCIQVIVGVTPEEDVGRMEMNGA
jgi:hypothetical protein